MYMYVELFLTGMYYSYFVLALDVIFGVIHIYVQNIKFK